jgi:hypothetical protein
MRMASFWSSQLGSLRLCTEFGTIDIEPCEIAVIPRGGKIRVELGAGTRAARGYICENYGGAFTLPERSDRRQLHGEPARFPHACCGLRGQRWFLHHDGKVGRRDSGARSSGLDISQIDQVAKRLTSLNILGAHAVCHQAMAPALQHEASHIEVDLHAHRGLKRIDVSARHQKAHSPSACVWHDGDQLACSSRRADAVVAAET